MPSELWQGEEPQENFGKIEASRSKLSNTDHENNFMLFGKNSLGWPKNVLLALTFGLLFCSLAAGFHTECHRASQEP